MAEIRPFRGVRYPVADLSEVLAPPYDVVSERTQAELIDRNPANVLAVDNPISGIHDANLQADAYARAARTFDSWLRQGILVHDAADSLYLVDHTFPLPGGGANAHRIGLIGLLPALPWSESPVRPHEHTFRGPKEDRLALMRATHAQTSPVFVMWAGAPDLDRLLEDSMRGEPLASASFSGEMGTESVRCFRLEGDELERVRSAMDDATLYMADGHHRYETAAAFATEWSRDHPGYVPSVLTFLSSSDDPGLILLPTHRVVTLPQGKSMPTWDHIIQALGEEWAFLDSGSQSGHESSDGHTFVIHTQAGTKRLVRRNRQSTSPAELLDVRVLHDELLPALGVGSDARIAFERDSKRAEEAVDSGEADLAVVMSPPSVADVLNVADAGETMPQKSTYFYPKVPTGIVIYSLED